MRTTIGLTLRYLAGFVLLSSIASFAEAVPTIGNIHQLEYNGSKWIDTTIVYADGSVAPDNSTLSSFRTDPDNNLHVFYMDKNTAHVHQLVYQLYFNGEAYKLGWVNNDLTELANGVTVNSEAPALSALTTNGVQYVYFCGSDNYLHEYSYGSGGNNSWVDSNASILAGASAGCISLTAMAEPNESGNRHIWLETSWEPSDIYQIANIGGVWRHEDDTENAGGAQGNGSTISSVIASSGQYVYFVAVSGDIHQLAYDKSNHYTWTDTDLTATVGAPQGHFGVAATYHEASNTFVVAYATGWYAIEALTFENNQWTRQALAGPLDLAAALLTVYATANGQIHIFYPGNPNSPGIYQDCWTNSAWGNQLLNSLGNWGGGATSGFPNGNDQYLYYFSDFD